ncbi:autophagy protein 13 [Apophysomyces ossiformis]|uniref:Autophagy-related protein 13 n=1 Tax=Apophysomyces ossiformis TaxID=679940 RepID=A0A8H7C0S2_9FUNG|nr:autophagy protein 13 [Apophysomyces ossiformis]
MRHVKNKTLQFNIATEDVDLLREDLKYWRSHAINSIDDEPPPMIVEIYLGTSKLTQNHTLVVADDNMRQNPVPLGPNESGLSTGVERILLESWTLTLNHPVPHFAVDLPNLYKRSIIFFRALHSLVRLLPCYNLYRRLRKFNDLNGLSIEYRFASMRIPREDEISIDTPIMDGDARNPTETYDFSGVVTPLGTFKLHVRYRRNCNFQIEDSERDLSARFIDMDEHYFTPTMAKYRQEQDVRPQRKQRPYSMYESETELTKEMTPAPKDEEVLAQTRRLSVDYSDPREIVQQRQRQSSIVSRQSPQSISPFNRDSLGSRGQSGSGDTPHVTPRRSSGSIVSPFKSPSLSSSPQADTILSGSRLHPSPSEKAKSTGPDSGSFGRKIEFSSSFDKYKDRPSPSRMDSGGTSMTRRWSRTSDHSSIHFFSESEDAELEEFMRFVRYNQDLKLFQSRVSITQLGESTNLSTTPSEASSIMGASVLTGGGSIYRSKKALSHFQNLRETHASLSESMSSSMMVGGASDRNETPSSAIGISPGSSASSAGRSYQPVVPSPLHAEQNTASPVYIPRQEAQAVPVSAESRHHRRHRSTQQGMVEESRGTDFRISPEMGAFSSYPQDRHHLELRRLCLPEDAHDEVERQQEHSHEGKTTASSSNRHGSGYPGSMLPADSHRRSTHEASTTGPSSSAGVQGGRSSVVDDDDSLVFKMSELGGESSSQQADTAPGPSDTAMLFNRPFSIESFNNTLEYAKRLRPQSRPTGALRRISSSGNIPQQTNDMATSTEKELRSPSDSASSSKSEPFIKPETYRMP